MPAARPARLLLAISALLLFLAAGPASGETLGPAEAAAMLEQLGPPKNPAYVHLNELADVEAIRFKRAPGLRVTSPGDGPIRLDPKKRMYLWAIDAEGKLHVAPFEKRKDGTESIGHTMLLGGRPARLAGELVWKKKKGKKGRWVLNNDSGRYSNRFATVTKGNLKAARRYIEAIGVESAGKKKVGRAELEHEFRKPDRIEPDQSGKKRAKAKKALIMTRLGGYLLKPPKGKDSIDALPPKYRSASDRLRWAARARERLGVAPEPGRWRAQMKSRSAARARARPKRSRSRARPKARTRAARAARAR